MRALRNRFDKLSIVTIVLESDVSEGAWMVSWNIHEAIQFLHPIPVVARVPNHHRPGGSRNAVHRHNASTPAG
jgi:hypothetical protein